MTEPEAWLTIAQSLVITEAVAWRTIARLISEGRWRHSGLCIEITMLTRRAIIPEDEMRARIDAHRDLSPRERHWLFPKGHASVRILFCYFLALEAEQYPDA